MTERDDDPNQSTSEIRLEDVREARRAAGKAAASSSAVIDIAKDVRALARDVRRLRHDMAPARELARDRIRTRAAIVFLFIAVIAAAWAQDFHVEECLVDVFVTEQATPGWCDIVFPEHAHGPRRADQGEPGEPGRPPWPTRDNIIGLTIYGAVVVAGLWWAGLGARGWRDTGRRPPDGDRPGDG